MRRREMLSLTDSVTEKHDSPLPETRKNEQMNELMIQTNLLGELSDTDWIKQANHEIHH